MQTPSLPSSTAEALARLAADLRALEPCDTTGAHRLISLAEVVFEEAFGAASREFSEVIAAYDHLTTEPSRPSPFADAYAIDDTDYWGEGKSRLAHAFEAALLKIARRGTIPQPRGLTFVSDERLRELSALAPTLRARFDLGRLIRLCEELNLCHAAGAYHAVAVLVRAVLDHVPPLFGEAAFAAVASNYSGGRSFRAAMKHLEETARKIADSHLHQPIRQTEPLPTAQQVNFSADLDVLLVELIRRHSGGV